jgi:hypothetical protein
VSGQNATAGRDKDLDIFQTGKTGGYHHQGGCAGSNRGSWRLIGEGI